MSESTTTPQPPKDEDKDLDPGNDQLKQQLKGLVMAQLRPLANALEIHVPAVIKKPDLVDLIVEEEPNLKLEDFSTILTTNQPSGSKTSKRNSTRQPSKTCPANDSDDDSEPSEDNHPKSDQYGHNHPTHVGFNTHHTDVRQPQHPPTKGSTNLQFTIGQHSYEFLFYIVESLPDPYSQIFLGNDFLASINADVLHRANGSALRINDDIIPNINLPLPSRGNPIQVNRIMTQSQDEVKTKICTEYPLVVSKHKFDIGKCTVQLEPIVHKNQELPPFHKYDVPFKLRSEVQRQVAELVSHDIIRPTSTIPHCFNLVCAPKKGPIRTYLCGSPSSQCHNCL